MRVTRKMVAEKAGVSEQTVSYVINHSRKLSEETIKKVTDAISELNYSPDMIAVSMKSKYTMTVGLILNDIENPIFPSIINSFQQAAFKKGYSTYICNLIDEEHSAAQIDKLIAQRVDGVYMSIPFNDESYKIVNKLISNNIKVVLGNKSISDKIDVPVVEVDFNLGMWKILNFLKENGHEKIVYLSGLDSASLNDSRYSYFKNNYRMLFNLEPHTIKNDPPYLTDVATGRKLAKKCLETYKDVTCVVTTNDLMAYGAIEYFNSIGMNVPNSISVIGIDNIDFSKYSQPSLTTLGYDYALLGKLVFETLYNEIYNSANNNQYIDATIYERNSVKNIN